MKANCPECNGPCKVYEQINGKFVAFYFSGACNVLVGKSPTPYCVTSYDNDTKEEALHNLKIKCTLDQQH